MRSTSQLYVLDLLVLGCITFCSGLCRPTSQVIPCYELYKWFRKIERIRYIPKNQYSGVGNDRGFFVCLIHITKETDFCKRISRKTADSAFVVAINDKAVTTPCISKGRKGGKTALARYETESKGEMTTPSDDLSLYVCRPASPQTPTPVTKRSYTAASRTSLDHHSL